MIGVLNTTNAVFRSYVSSTCNLRNISTHTQPLYFRVTDTLLGEPLKKKKRIDPAVVRAREERRKKKLEKRIRLLEKHSNHMKPIFEIDGLLEQLKNDNRTQDSTMSLSREEIEKRILLGKEWSKHKQKQWLQDLHAIKSMITSQETALKELKAVSVQLYKKAIECDDLYLPHNVDGPAHTPPISNYDSPDGEYIETTIKYAGE